MRRLETLTVQDLLWINLQLTGGPQPFDFARLEESTFAQYGLGANDDPIRLGGKLFMDVAKRAPFAFGNTGTALVAGLAFWRLNGVEANATSDEVVNAAMKCLTQGNAKSLVELAVKLDGAHQGHHTKEGVLADIVASFIGRLSRIEELPASVA